MNPLTPYVEEVAATYSQPVRSRAAIIGLVLLLAAGWMVMFSMWSPPAQAHGCGTSDHYIEGDGPWSFEAHYFEWTWTSQNSLYHKWTHVGIGGGFMVDTWCGCLDQSRPCANIPGAQVGTRPSGAPHLGDRQPSAL